MIGRLRSAWQHRAGVRRRLALLLSGTRARRAVAEAERELVTARRELDAGRYMEALRRARGAAAEGARGAPSLVSLLEGHLAVLQPGWRPDPGRRAGRLGKAKGGVTRGRVLHVVGVSLPYRVVGYTVRTQAVARSQADAGLDPHVVTRAGFPGNDGHPGAPEHAILDGVPYHHLLPDFRSGRPDRGLNATARAAIGILEQLRPAVLQPASNVLMARTALALARPLGIPVVYEVRGFWEDSWAASRPDEENATASDRYRFTRAAETEAMLEADAVVTLSEVMRAEIVDRGCAPERVVVVPNAVDPERFTPVPRDAALAASLGIGPTDPVVGYVSSLTAYEDVPLVLEAVAELRERFPRLRALIVGDGPEAAGIRAAGERLGLPGDAVVMPGSVPHGAIARYYSLIDVFVVARRPSRVSRLVTPLKPFEAMALARPVVVSDLQALREVVTDGETGLSVPAGDRAAMVDALGRLLDDSALRSRLGSQAREWVVANRTWSANGRRYRALFEQLGAA